MRVCACGCARAWRPLNPLRRYHPECDGVSVVPRPKRRYTRHVPEDAAAIEARYQAARAARLRQRWAA